MIQAEAIEYIKSIPPDSGASEPVIVSVKAVTENNIFEAYAKLSTQLDMGTKAYSVEAISSMLAKDLDILTPEPCIVNFSDPFIDSVHDIEIQSRLRRSSKTVFATRKLPEGFTDIPKNDYPLTKNLLLPAAHIFCFDAAIENTDRGGFGRPNCMTNGKNFAIIDHEKAFPQAAGIPLIGSKRPWDFGGLEHYKTPNSHIFVNELVRNSAYKLDLGTLLKAWKFITDKRLKDYGASLPLAWVDDPDLAAQILQHISEVRENLEDLVTEVYRVWRRK